MCQRRRARAFRAADLERDDGLAVRARAPRGVEEVRRVGDRFDVAEDDFHFRTISEVIDEVADRGADLAAAGSQITELKSEVVDHAVDLRAHRAALRDQRDRARCEFLQRFVGDGGEARCTAAEPHAVRPDGGDAGLCERRAQPRTEAAAGLAAAFAETSGEDRGAARTGGAALAQHRDGGLGGREDREVVGRFRQRAAVREARLAPDLPAVRVHRQHAAGEAKALEIVPHPHRPMVGAVGRADQHHVARMEQRVDGVFAGGLRLHSYVPGAALHEAKRSSALQTRDPGFYPRIRNRGPASAVHRFALHRVRDTNQPLA